MSGLLMGSEWIVLVVVLLGMGGLISVVRAGEAALRADLPHLRRQGAATQLIVEGRPFIILGGELHNSSASSLEYMAPVWPRLAALNLNTVLATVSWELLEPEEGKFDFGLVDGLIQGARRHHLRLVLLWFGSWKNGVSSYAPAWVKKDLKRFPRVQRQDGWNVEVLSPLSDANCRADARALAALMQHVRDVDRGRQTVLMVQVENEAGLLGQTRDYSPPAEEAFRRPVPAELMDYLLKHKDTLIPEFKAVWEAAGARGSGTWPEVFGEGADETFMAWHVARHIGRVAAAGKAEYPLPMFANAWLIQPGNEKPGQYPSGGPVSKVMDVWRAAAPAIDFLAPDIYLPDFKGTCARYTRSGNPLFIPEVHRGPESASRVFYAIGNHDAIGFCPFGIDGVPADHPVAASYALLSEMIPVIAAQQGLGRMAGILIEKDEDLALELGDYRVEVSPKVQGRANLPAYGLVIASGPEEFLLAGAGMQVGFAARTAGPGVTAILSVDEGHFKDGQWIPGRRLNGDESAANGRAILPAGPLGLLRVKLYRHA